MSHSSGIPASDSLRNSFGSTITSKDKRVLKVQIENDKMNDVASLPISGTWEEDLAAVPTLFDKQKPCFILFRLDSETAQFVLFCYVPDKAPVKEKMLYASSRSNLKQQLGLTYFVDEVFGTVVADFTLEGYQHHVQSKKSEAPLTEQEQIKKNELESGPIYSGGQTTYVHGVAFPVDPQASDAMKKLVSGGVNYVQIAIDCDKERIILDHSGKVDFEGLLSEIRADEPRFHFYSYAHEFEGASVKSIVFIYSCPDGSKGTKSAPVRMRMLYSSSKANVADSLGHSGGKIEGRMEVNTAEDITEELLVTILHPVKEEKKANFSKPTKPGKGGRQMIRK